MGTDPVSFPCPLCGDGEIVGEYIDGKKSVHHAFPVCKDFESAIRLVGVQGFIRTVHSRAKVDATYARRVGYEVI